jgi:predicted membrane-bound spermidine synthase
VATQTGVSPDSLDLPGEPRRRDLTIWIYLLFFTSGIPAIIYQIVWQRALFALYGINIESVTIVVSAFMLGLGLGSLGGGALSRSRRLPPVALFAAAELGTAIFGLASLTIFHSVAQYTLARPIWITGIISLVLVVVPTTLMGSTLPLLIEHLVRSSRNVGSSVGALYFVNTLGSGAACIVVIRPLMSYFGQTGAVRCAAVVNALVGVSALIYSFHCERERPEEESVAASELAPSNERLLPFALALLCAAFCGFSALSYEIIWYRLLAFAAADTAPVFVSLLGSYLLGIALGSRFAEGYAERHSGQATIPILAMTLLGSGVVSFWTNPASAWALKIIPPGSSAGGLLASFLFLFFICHATILFGALFPLIAHVAVGPQRAGTAVSYLYAANIAGSTLGVLLVGFILMDRFSLYRIAWLLLMGSILCAAAVFWIAPRLPRIWGPALSAVCITAAFFAPASHAVFATIYDRLLFKKFYPLAHFEQVIENRSGTIGVTPDGIVFGGGVYDGRFSTDLLNDTNVIVRPYALGAFDADPSRVLMIGLGSGSWAQVVVNNPQVQELTIVEINPGYLEAIPKHAATASLLHNPKVTIVIDDGRRWLLRHPQETFDAVVMNASFYWRDHLSNLLSTDFLQIVRMHLRPHGVFFYNTTGSDDVVATGLAVFPYALRVYNAVALSDSPLVFDRERWKSVLLNYTIDGKRVVDANNPAQMKRLDGIVNVADGPPLVGEGESIEGNDEMRRRLRDRRSVIVTDDNMGLEWR